MGKRERVEERISLLRNELLGNVNQQKFKGILQTIDILKYSSIADKFLRAGDRAHDFLLPNALGEWFSLKEQVKKGKVLLVFIRGGWSPYCYLQLRKIQEKLEELKKLKVNVLAVSCETRDYCLNTMERNGLKFQVLSDKGNRVADFYNLVYKNESSALLHDIGFGQAVNKNDLSNQLPVPATFIVDEWMTLRYAHVNPDYRQRPNMDEVIERLKTMY